MYCQNFSEVDKWFKKLSEHHFVIERVDPIPVRKICTVSPIVELKRNVQEWIEGGEWTTFWHMKQLMMTLRQSDVLVPIVLTRPKNSDSINDLYFYVDPGGSRMIVLSHIDPNRTIPIDCVWPNEYVNEIDQLGGHRTITNYKELLQPYEDIGLPYQMLLCKDDPCDTCRTHNKIHNRPYRFTVQWNNNWFYEKNAKGFDEWYDKNKHYRPHDIMDWYTI
jgi:hypothetical protein